MLRISHLVCRNHSKKKTSVCSEGRAVGNPSRLPSHSSGPRFCSAHWSDGRPEAISFLVLSTNIRCEVAWLDASACDTRCLVVVGMLWWFLIRPRGLPLTFVRQRTANLQLVFEGVLYGQAKDRRPTTTRHCCRSFGAYLLPAERAIRTVLAPIKCLLSLLTTTWRKPHVFLFCCFDINLLFSFPL